MDVGLLTLGDLLTDPLTGRRQWEPRYRHYLQSVADMFDMGGMPDEQVFEAIELTGADVIPAVRDL